MKTVSTEWTPVSAITDSDFIFACEFETQRGVIYVGQYNDGEFLGYPKKNRKGPLQRFSPEQIRRFRRV